MTKIIAKTAALSGASSGLSTLILLDAVNAFRAYHDNIYYLIIVFVGDVIIYALPAVLGSAIVGLVLGMLSGYIVGSISKGKIEARLGALCGGLVGGIPLGLLPFWLGFGYMY